MIAGAAAAAAGFIFMLSAPANFLRLEEAGTASFQARFTSMARSVREFYLIPGMIYAALLSATGFVCGADTLRKSMGSILFAVCGFAAAGAMIIPSMAPGRAYFGGVVFMTAAIMIQGKVLLSASGRTSYPVIPAMLIAGVALFFSFGHTAFELRDIKRLHDAREGYIRGQAILGERDVTVFRIRTSAERSAFKALGDISVDPGHWKNAAIAEYYGIDTIRTDER
jgi:hypothetical protein